MDLILYLIIGVGMTANMWNSGDYKTEDRPLGVVVYGLFLWPIVLILEVELLIRRIIKEKKCMK